MSRVLGEPDDVFARLDSLQQQLNALKRTSQLSAANITGGNLQVSDTAGNVRVQVGNILGGDYGVLVADLNGNTEELLPTVSSYFGPVITATTTSFASYTGAPSLTAVIGQSGNAKVSFSATIFSSSGGSQPIVGLSVDGGAAFALLVNNSINQVSVAGNRILKSWAAGPGLLTPGSHVFSFVYQAAGSVGTAAFADSYLEVKPL